MMGGGLGMAPLERMLRPLDDVGCRWPRSSIAGRNARVGARVLAAAESVAYPVRALRFVDNVYDYMHAADAFVTKPGGLSLAEALAAAFRSCCSSRCRARRSATRGFSATPALRSARAASTNSPPYSQAFWPIRSCALDDCRRRSNRAPQCRGARRRR